MSAIAKTAGAKFFMGKIYHASLRLVWDTA
jgi:hypothetical protein